MCVLCRIYRYTFNSCFGNLGDTLRSLCVLQSLSIKEETQNRSLYSCVVLISFVIISIDGLVLIYRLRRREWGGEGARGFLLCHDKIYLTPLRLYSILMIPIICNQFCIVLPLYSLTDDWSPLRSSYPKTPPDLPPLLINCWQVAKCIKVTSRFPLLSQFHLLAFEFAFET